MEKFMFKFKGHKDHSFSTYAKFSHISHALRRARTYQGISQVKKGVKQTCS